jgi:large-conductance mechanosensitive channel
MNSTLKKHRSVQFMIVAIVLFFVAVAGGTKAVASKAKHQSPSPRKVVQAQEEKDDAILAELLAANTIQRHRQARP